MSELKWLNKQQLDRAKADTKKTIEYHLAKANGQRERLKWIDFYLKLQEYK